MKKFMFLIASLSLFMFGCSCDVYEDFLENEIVEIKDCINNSLCYIESDLDWSIYYYLLGQQVEAQYILSNYRAYNFNYDN